jgi:hypothetical protein
MIRNASRRDMGDEGEGEDEDKGEDKDEGAGAGAAVLTGATGSCG